MSSISYAPHGTISAAQLGNSLWSSTNFNSRLQITGMGLGTTQGTSDIWGLVNIYSPTQNNGNIQSQSLTVPGMRTLNSYFIYDGLNRLSIAAESPSNPVALVCPDTGSQWCRQFNYIAEGNGNRAIAGSTGQGISPLTPASFTPNNQIADSGWTYDRGNVIKQRTGETFHYDAENRQVVFCTQDANPSTCVQAAGAGRTLYYYNDAGRRVMIQAPDASTTVFAYDAAGNLAGEYLSGTPPAPLPAIILVLFSPHIRLFLANLYIFS